MTAVVTAASARQEPRGPRGARLRAALRADPAGAVGGALVVVLVLAGVGAPLLAPYPPTQVHFALPFQVPLTIGFPLGTDDLGRDLASRTLYGLRSSLQVAAIGVAVSVVLGTLLGLAAGWWRRLDPVIARITDVMLAFPFLVLAIGFAAVQGPSLGGAAISLGLAYVPHVALTVRAETLRVRATDFVLAARAMDARAPGMLLGHVLPNAASTIVVQATVILPQVVLGEAVLSFLGLGIQPPGSSLGIMLSDAQQYLYRTAWPAVLPGVVLALLCLAFNLVGDALRDRLDPATGARR
ncbi:ABC transporter permease [Actinomycetospora sp. NBRC 106378]|uniref:ABC transporter permease n=1 Tax=Actinomycetospora sp. NBRC 106378 TaxID=3032208 RepID=UPI0024A4320C|nr:ABC transporter permease [Actinomycetospora sp. NBRC 106378]GLZ54416.1 ABC transporter permease [Actinomycetospora sp. NBRC 106378]